MKTLLFVRHSASVPRWSWSAAGAITVALSTWLSVFGGLVAQVFALPPATHEHAATAQENVFPIPLFSGRLAVLPDPMQADVPRSQMGQALAALDLARHVVFLTPQQMVDPAVFNVEPFPVALYVAGEPYWQTVREAGDGDAALLRYLGAGGRLLVLPSGPLPFFYNQDQAHVGSAGKLGLQMGGGGAFSVAPEGRQLMFRRHAGDAVFTTLPREFPFPGPHEADQRWRPITNAVGEGARYEPFITLHDETGRAYGEGAAGVELASGARVLYVWTSLMAHDDTRRKILVAALRYALDGLAPPPARLSCPRVFEPISVDAALDELIWDGAPASSPFVLPGEALVEAPQQTVVRACWDTTHLYLALQCRPAPASAVDDSVRIALAAEEAEQPYLTVTLTRQNALSVELTATDEAPLPHGAAKIYSVVASDEDGWRAELAIPMTMLPPASRQPQFGGTLRAQFLRGAVQPIGASAEGTSADQVASVWSASSDPARVDRFGALVFSANPWSDDFDAYASSADSSRYWTFGGGEWRIEDGALVGRDASEHWSQLRGAMRGDDNWRDYSFSVRFQLASRGSGRFDGAWFGLRCSPEGDGYVLQIGDGAWYLHKVVYGIATQPGNALAEGVWHPDDAWHELVLVARGNRLQGTLDGAPLFSVKDDAHLTLPSRRRGGIVLAPGKASRSRGTTTVRYDDVIVRMLED